MTDSDTHFWRGVELYYNASPLVRMLKEFDPEITGVIRTLRKAISHLSRSVTLTNHIGAVAYRSEAKYNLAKVLYLQQPVRSEYLEELVLLDEAQDDIQQIIDSHNKNPFGHDFSVLGAIQEYAARLLAFSVTGFQTKDRVKDLLERSIKNFERAIELEEVPESKAGLYGTLAWTQYTYVDFVEWNRRNVFFSEAIKNGKKGIALKESAYARYCLGYIQLRASQVTWDFGEKEQLKQEGKNNLNRAYKLNPELPPHDIGE